MAPRGSAPLAPSLLTSPPSVRSGTEGVTLLFSRWDDISIEQRQRDLPIAFVPQQLTSYGGLELLRRYVRRIALPRRLQAACAALGGDYGGARLALLLLALP